MRGRGLPFGSGLSAKAKGKRPAERESIELPGANHSLPQIAALQPSHRNGIARAATYAHPERQDVDASNRFEKGEERSRSRTRDTIAATATIDGLKSSGEQDNMILVMGSTGAGKSRFINKLAQGDEAREGHSLRSETKECQAVTIRIGRNVVTVVDTPGFGDDAIDDGRTLNNITRFLTAQYKLGFRLKGVIFLHQINKNRIGSEGLRLLRIFTAIWGDEALPNVALVSTMWSKVDLGEGIRRDIELRGDIWQRLVSKGSAMFQYNDSTGMAETIVNKLAIKSGSIVLKIQKELVDQKRLLAKTSAGSLVSADIQERLQVSREDRQFLERELADAASANDYARQREINRLLKDQMRKHLRSTDDLIALGQDIVLETEVRIEEIEKEQRSKMLWTRALSRIQKFAKVLSPRMTVTLTVLPTVSVAVQLG